MNLKILFKLHAIITLAAAIVLIVAPAAIPGTVDIHLHGEAYLLSYFLGASELAIAYLSFFATRINDRYALRIIVITFVIFHLGTAFLEIWALSEGASIKLVGNIALRCIVVLLFYYYGVRKISKKRI